MNFKQNIRIQVLKKCQSGYYFMAFTFFVCSISCFFCLLAATVNLSQSVHTVRYNNLLSSEHPSTFLRRSCNLTTVSYRFYKTNQIFDQVQVKLVRLSNVPLPGQTKSQKTIQHSWSTSSLLKQMRSARVLDFSAWQMSA